MPPELKENIMYNIAYLRRCHGLSRTRMAAMLHVGPGTIRKLEAHVWTPNLPGYILLYVMHYFGVDPDTLLYTRLDEKDAAPADQTRP